MKPQRNIALIGATDLDLTPFKELGKFRWSCETWPLAADAALLLVHLNQGELATLNDTTIAQLRTLKPLATPLAAILILEQAASHETNSAAAILNHQSLSEKLQNLLCEFVDSLPPLVLGNCESGNAKVSLSKLAGKELGKALMNVLKETAPHPLTKPEAGSDYTVALRLVAALSTTVQHNDWVRLTLNAESSRARLRFRHYGSKKTSLSAGDSSFADLKLATPIKLAMGERLIVHGDTPMTLLGAAQVLLPNSGDESLSGAWNETELSELAATLNGQESWATLLKKMIGRAGRTTTTLGALARATHRPLETIAMELEEELLQGRVLTMQAAELKPSRAHMQSAPLILAEEFNRLQSEALTLVTAPTAPAIVHQKLGKSLHPQLFNRLVASLIERGDWQLDEEQNLTLPGKQRAKTKGARQSAKATSATAKKRAKAAGLGNGKGSRKNAGAKELEETAKESKPITERMLDLIQRAGLTPPNTGELAALLGVPAPMAAGFVKSLVKQGAVLLLPGDFYLDASKLSALAALLLEHFATSPQLTFAEFKTKLGLSRKYVTPLLEYLDAQRYLVRNLSDDSRLPGPSLGPPPIPVSGSTVKV